VTEEIKQEPAATKPTPDAPPTTWEAIFEHPRFKELATAKQTLAKQLADIEAEKAATEKDKLAKAAEWEKLNALLKSEKDALAAQIEAIKAEDVLRQKRQAIKAAALAHDPPFSEQAAEDAYLFIALDTLDNDPKAVKAAVKALAEARTYMLTPGKRKDPGSPGVTGPNRGMSEEEKARRAYQVRL
jgi:hypothetical protein